jgi:hypothetical protein
MLANALRRRDREEHVFPISPRLAEEQVGRCSRPKPRDHSRLRTVLPQERRPMRPGAGADRLRRGLQFPAPHRPGSGVAEGTL